MAKHLSMDKMIEKLDKGNGPVVVGNETVARLEGGQILVSLFGNHIMSIDRETKDVTVTSAGWMTMTTKDRLNWFLPAGCYVYQEKGAWYIKTPRGTWGFKDNALITTTGSVLHAGDPVDGDDGEGDAE